MLKVCWLNCIIHLGPRVDGDPKHAIGFRRVYANLLRGWLATSPEPILGGAFELLPLLRA